VDAEEATQRRDRLLAAAVAVVDRARRDGTEPQELTRALHEAWRPLAGPAVVFDDDFEPDPATGVEALAFLVGTDRATARGGLVLRLRDELPDSFEAVDPPGSADRSPLALRRAYFTPST
jgi:hypothetical protein